MTNITGPINDPWPKSLSLEEIARRCAFDDDTDEKEILDSLAKAVDSGLLNVNNRDGMELLYDSGSAETRVASLFFNKPVYVTNEQFRAYLENVGPWPISTDSPFAILLPWLSKLGGCRWPSVLDIRQIVRICIPEDLEHQKEELRSLARDVRDELLPATNKTYIIFCHGEAVFSRPVYVQEGNFPPYLEKKGLWPILPSSIFAALNPWFELPEIKATSQRSLAAGQRESPGLKKRTPIERHTDAQDLIDSLLNQLESGADSPPSEAEAWSYLIGGKFKSELIERIGSREVFLKDGRTIDRKRFKRIYKKFYSD